jgi:hypothetical protein
MDGAATCLYAGFAISTTKLPGGATGAIALLSNPARFAALTHPHKVE